MENFTGEKYSENREKNWSEKKKKKEEGNFTVLSSLHQTFSSDLA